MKMQEVLIAIRLGNELGLNLWFGQVFLWIRMFEVLKINVQFWTTNKTWNELCN